MDIWILILPLVRGAMLRPTYRRLRQNSLCEFDLLFSSLLPLCFGFHSGLLSLCFGQEEPAIACARIRA